MPEIAKISHRHEAIMAYMVAHPTAKLGDVAAEFGVSQPWLSCIIHSNAFQTKLRERQESMFGALGASITEKLSAVAHAALDNLLEHTLASNVSPEQQRETAALALKSLGYGTNSAPPSASPAQTNNFFLSREDLAAARLTIQAGTPDNTMQLEVSVDAHRQERVDGNVLEHAATVPQNN